jgi:hypothetical protein
MNENNKSAVASFKDEENHEEFQDSRLVGQTSNPRFFESESHLPLSLHYNSTTSKCAVTTRICSWLSCSMLMHCACHSAGNRMPIVAAAATTQSYAAYCLPDICYACAFCIAVLSARVAPLPRNASLLLVIRLQNLSTGMRSRTDRHADLCHSNTRLYLRYKTGKVVPVFN